MSDLIMEADEALKQERLFQFWAENRAIIITFIVCTIIGTGLASGYKSWNKSQRESDTQAALTIINHSTFPDNVAGQDLNLSPNMDTLVKLTAAGQYIGFEDLDTAREIYKTIPDNANRELSDLANLFTARLDGETPKSLKDSDTPWQYYAYLDQSLSLADQNDYAGARTALKPVLDGKTLPPTLYQRARALDMVFAIKAQQYASDKAE